MAVSGARVAPSTRRWVVSFAAVICAAVHIAVAAGELPAKVVAAFDRYMRATEARMARDRAAGSWLWLDTESASRRNKIYKSLRKGEVVTSSLRTEDNGKRIDVDGAIFLHTVGAVLIPKGTVAQTIGVLQDYDHHSTIFAPIVRQSRVLEHHDNHYSVYRQLFHDKIVTFVYNMEFAVTYEQPSPTRAACRSFATRGAEVVNFGTPNERERPMRGNPANQWRLNTYCRAEQRSEGTYLEYETLFVAPDLPWYIEILATPIVKSFPADASTKILKATQRIVAAQTAAPNARNQER